ncbi:hypothetical protein BHF71_08735 [Vulcanibacillus modesticaldus]|uniref:Flagellar hook-associated protein 2 n=2 Tax=Vulcanibacillus modesticaldus TaxID=337097 RepID=A0A1D2YUY2_9BACI|nr:hypothetical protein BHF71_08735 [Vulcanibacillus modesticaldus]
MRIGGFASGLDIDSIVNDLMKAERIPLDKMKQDKQILEWQRDDYREMNSLLNELDEFIFDGIYMQGSFTKKIITSSNENAVSAKNINSISDVYASIRVDQLAEAAYINSAADIRANTAFDPNGNLVDEAANLVDFNTSYTSFTIQAIQADGTLGSAISFTIDPNTESLNDVINKINNSNAGVNIFYDQQTGRISMTAKNTGDVSGQPEIIITGDFLTKTLGLASDNVVAGANGNLGKNAKFNINGIDTERPSNTFIINGFEYTLKQVTDDGDSITEPGELVTINSTTDTDQIVDTIVKFVDKYNEIIEKINDKLSEERYRDYPPLTDDQKKELSDNEIELWEEKAKSGLLRNDSLLSNGLNQMRTTLYTPVQGINTKYDQLSEIGITTSSNYLDKGKLIIDENKLRQAIQDDALAVYDLFNKEVKDASGNLVYDQSGIARRLRDVIDQTITNVEARAGNSLKTNAQFTIGRNLDRINKDIADFETRLIELEDKYWRQFTEMEKAINRYNSQFGALMSQLGQGQ